MTLDNCGFSGNHSADVQPPTYPCGTLEYTKRGLLVLFGWLLWGDVCFTLMEAVVPSILPLKFRALGAPNWLIGAALTTVPGIFGATVGPWISFRSDRHRGRWGRRRPFIIGTLPFLTAALVLIAWSDGISGWLRHLFADGGMSPTVMTLMVISLFTAMFAFFNLYVGSLYVCLLNDVVPDKLRGTFFSWFRLVGTASSAAYNFFIFRFAESHMREIFLGTAILYGIGFGLMCLRVKEGEYPPSPPEQGRPSLGRDLQTFARECFVSRFYWYIFLESGFGMAAWAVFPFYVFFQLSLGLDLAYIGKLGAVTSLLLATFMPLCGRLVDRWNPVRVYLYCHLAAVFQLSFFLVWVFVGQPSNQAYFWLTTVNTAFFMGQQALNICALMPRTMILFPRDRYGQFCGAQALVTAVCSVTAGVLAGLVFDRLGHFFPKGSQFPYRFLFYWTTAVMTLTVYCHYRAYRYWKRLGGERSFQPPVGNVDYQRLPPAAAEDSGIRTALLLFPRLMFIGSLLWAVGFALHFYFQRHDSHSAIVFGIVAALTPVLYLFYRRVISFAERP